MLTLKEKLEDIACNENITVINTPLPHTKSASSKDFRIIAVDREKEKSGDEETADLAHEIGHFFTGSFYNVEAPLCMWGKCEAKAAAWTVQYLCPLAQLKAVIKAGYRCYWEIAEELGVHQKAVEKAIDIYQRRGLL